MCLFVGTLLDVRQTNMCLIIIEKKYYYIYYIWFSAEPLSLYALLPSNVFSKTNNTDKHI